jgi:hypothetical protein
MNSNGVGGVVLAVLLILAGITANCVATKNEPPIEVEPVPKKPGAILASRDFSAFTLLKKGDLQLRKSTDGSPDPDIDNLENRYLLVPVKSQEEVEPDNVAAAGATDVIKGSIAITIPASPTTTLGGQLRAGEFVEVVALPAKEEAPIIKVDNVMVLNIVPPNKEANLPGTITLAVPSAKRDDFARAISRTQYFVTRTIEVNKQEQTNSR